MTVTDTFSSATSCAAGTEGDNGGCFEANTASVCTGGQCSIPLFDARAVVRSPPSSYIQDCNGPNAGDIPACAGSSSSPSSPEGTLPVIALRQCLADAAKAIATTTVASRELLLASAVMDCNLYLGFLEMVYQGWTTLLARKKKKIYQVRMTSVSLDVRHRPLVESARETATTIQIVILNWKASFAVDCSPFLGVKDRVLRVTTIASSLKSGMVPSGTNIH